MKNTMFATLIALVAGCGVAQAGEGNPHMRRYYDAGPASIDGVPVDVPPIAPAPGRFNTLSGLPPCPANIVPFPFEENAACRVLVRDGIATIAFFSSHERESCEIASEDRGHLIDGRLAGWQAKRYCLDLPPAVIAEEPPVVAGPARVLPFFGR